MEFAFTAEQEAFRHEFRDWLEGALPDGWIAGDRALPEDEADRRAFLADWQRTMADDGWIGARWPEAYGGMGLTVMEELIYQEERNRVDAPSFINSLGIDLVGPTLIEMGADWQKERFIPNILNAEEIWCQGYSEPNHGSDIAGLETAAERDGDEFVIDGEKIWTSNAHFADYCILLCRTDFSGTKHEGITALIVDMDQDGVTTERIHQANDERGFNHVYFDGAVAPEEHVVGEVGQGWDVIRTISAYEQSWTRAFDAERRFNEILQYCRHNERDGLPLAEHPHVKRKLAEFDVRIQAAKLSRYRNISKRLDDPVPGPEGSLDVAKGDELVIDVEEFGFEMTGPETTLWEDGIDGGRRVKDWLLWIGLWIGGGSGDIQRNIIGEQVLRLPKDIKSEYTHRRDGGPGADPGEESAADSD